MKDRKGRLVPISQISDYDLAMDSFVREQVTAAKIKRDELSDFKRRAFDEGNDSNLLIVFYVQIMPDDFVMQLHRF
ncbi:DUF3164 family protein [Klebsiella pneumoniae subsp. ozaenae]